MNATTDDARKGALKLHLASVRAHIASLARSGYHSPARTPKRLTSS